MEAVLGRKPLTADLIFDELFYSFTESAKLKALHSLATLGFLENI
jgi:hypothetical protein